MNARATLGTKRTDPVLGEIRTLERKRPDFGAALREGMAAHEESERRIQAEYARQMRLRAEKLKQLVADGDFLPDASNPAPSPRYHGLEPPPACAGCGEPLGDFGCDACDGDDDPG